MFYIGIMTGNSMDAVDMAYASTDGETYLELKQFGSYPFSRDMQQQIAALRSDLKKCRTRVEVENLPNFLNVHHQFIQTVAKAVADFVNRHQIDLTTLSGICFHGKTLDHCPPSRQTGLLKGRCTPYTVQLGSGQMLADAIFDYLDNPTAPAIRVIYDFRSDDIFAQGEGAPLIPVLNAFLARQQGVLNRIDINAGNTSNLCLIQKGEPIGGWDLGPCNEYADYLVRSYTDQPFDKGGEIASKGKVDFALLRRLFEIGRSFYEKKPPKSGDPAVYGTNLIQEFQTGDCLCDKVRTSLYFSAYVAVFGLQFISGELPSEFLLFGGGWKNKVLYQSFVDLLTGKGGVLPEHEFIFETIRNRLAGPINCVIDQNAQSLESLLMVLMGAYYDLKKPWTTPCLTGCAAPSVLGVEAVSLSGRSVYNDMLCRACF